MTTPTKPVSGSLPRFLFTRRLSWFDLAYVLAALRMAIDSHWLIVVAVIMAGACISVAGERSLARSKSTGS